MKAAKTFGNIYGQLASQMLTVSLNLVLQVQSEEEVRCKVKLAVEMVEQMEALVCYCCSHLTFLLTWKIGG